jgi:oligopeptide transport system substrate-binding protein
MRFVSLMALTALLMFGGVACATAPIPTYGPLQPGTPSPTKFNPTAVPTTTSPPVLPKVLRIDLGSRPDILDPQRASTSAEIAVLQLAYEGLTRVDEKGNVVPGAARSWEFSSDGKTLTFHLRSGLERADGTPLTAKDFEYAFKHALDPRIGAYAQSFLDDVHGAVAAYSLDPKSRPEDIQKALDNVGIKAVDDSTLTVTFDQPTGYWPTIASTWIGFPSDKRKEDANPDAWWLKPENQNGNGPFKISDIEDQVIKLVPNPNYWGGKAKLDRIEFYWISDPAAELNAYRKGEVDIVHLSSDNFVQAQSDPALNKDLVRGPAARVTYLGFNVKKAPFTDRAVRLAFSQALDREGFVRDVLKGLGKPYLSWIPPGTPGYDPTATVPGYDPNAAVQTLINAGYGTPDKKRVDCNKLGTIKLTYSNTPRTQFLFQFIAGSLTRVFPCQVLLDPIDPSVYPITVRDPKTTPQVFLIPWEQEYPHPQDWLFLQTCNGVYAARIGYCNKDFDAAFAAANQELDFSQAIAKYQAAQKIFITDVPGAFLWTNENAWLIKPYVVGLWDHNSSGDTMWPGQYGPILTYDIDTSKVSAGYPAQ